MNHVTAYRITSQLVANETDIRQWTCAEWRGKCWKCS